MNLPSIPKETGGIYILCIETTDDLRIDVGKLGNLEFKNGIHVYVGSAMNGLYHRINRHISNSKKIRWHIDYLLEHARVFKVYYAITSERKECAVSNFFNEKSQYFKPVPNFGNSDCTNCPSHLYSLKILGSLNKFDELLRKSLESSGLEAKILQIS
ncbi:MAG: DUF123 domain-containing protein [Candidatus Hodarchaeota archaeon]